MTAVCRNAPAVYITSCGAERILFAPLEAVHITPLEAVHITNTLAAYVKTTFS